MERNTLFCFFFIYCNDSLNYRCNPKWFSLFLFSLFNKKQLYQNQLSLVTWILVGNMKIINFSCMA